MRADFLSLAMVDTCHGEVSCASLVLTEPNRTRRKAVNLPDHGWSTSHDCLGVDFPRSRVVNWLIRGGQLPVILGGQLPAITGTLGNG